VHCRIACKINEVPGFRRARICCLEPQGLGKPEPLKFGLPGWWSRRISGEHRLVYRVPTKANSSSSISSSAAITIIREHDEAHAGTPARFARFTNALE
jgi:hypothetical protein